jgi:hypothetical protein
MNDKEKDNFELEYLLESVKRYNIQEPPKESFDWLFHLLFTVIPVALVAWGLVSLQHCESDFKSSERNKMLQQDIKYRSCVNVRAIDRAAADPQTYHEEIARETKAEDKVENDIPKVVWSDHNGNYMKCRKDFVKYLKYCQRYISDPTHDPMYVRAEISGDVLNLISYSFKQLPSNQDRVFSEYEQMILDCKFSEVRMCPLTSTKYFLYWKDGEKYKYWKQ